MAIAFVQYDDYYASAAGGTIANDTALNTTTGNLIVALIGAFSGTSNACIVTGVVDTALNTYVKATGAYRDGVTIGPRSEIWYVENATGNANNITTATFTGNASNRNISIAEFSGVLTTSSLLDTSTLSDDTATAHSSGTATSTNTGDLIVGEYSGNSLENITVGDGFTALSSDLTSVVHLAEYDILGVAGDYAATCTTGTTSTSITGCAIFGVAAPPASLTSINIGDAWKEIISYQINIGDAWKDVIAVQINIGDTWKTVL